MVVYIAIGKILVRGENMKLRKQICWMLFFLLGICMLTGCKKRGQVHNTWMESGTETTQTIAEKEKTLTGVITKVDVDAGNIHLIDVNDEWSYTFSYDVYTQMLSRYGEAMAVSQLAAGEIVDVTFAQDTMKLEKLQISYDAWEYEEVKGLTYNQTENKIQIMGKEYIYTASLVLRDATSGAAAAKEDGKENQEDKEKQDGQSQKNGEMQQVSYHSQKEEIAGEMVKEDASDKEQEQEQEIEEGEENVSTGKKVDNNILLSDISQYDTVTCRGYKGKIYSVTVTSGHGYVRLSGYSTYIGGMIVIGDVMADVTKDMVLTVPAGEWTLEIDKDGTMGTKQIVVEQNVEQTVNLADLTIVACQKGIFHFVLSPANATITIDDVEYSGRTEFMLEYGVHKIVVSAVGYKSYNGTINLQVPYMNINVGLVTLDADDESTADTSTKKNSTSSATTQETTKQQDTQESAEENASPNETTQQQTETQADATETQTTTTQSSETQETAG